MVSTRWKDTPPVREELVTRVKREIDAGRYDTPERLSAALDRMLRRTLGR